MLPSIHYVQTFLVTGGTADDIGWLSSTELLEENSSTWRVAGELPTPRFLLRVAVVDSRVLATGMYHVF